MNDKKILYVVYVVSGYDHEGWCSGAEGEEIPNHVHYSTQENTFSGEDFDNGSLNKYLLCKFSHKAPGCSSGDLVIVTVVIQNTLHCELF